MNNEILRIALPAIISNITVPLLGLVDIAIVGHLGAAAYIGAIAIGGMLFNVIYWIFAFLRMGTSGMTAQALGRGDREETMRMLARSVTVAMTIALLLIVLQMPIKHVAFLIMQPTGEIARLASTYYNICIWGAPAMLGMFSLTGWFIGMQDSRVPMIVSITQNCVNIAASLVLVFGLGMKVEGVALGTLTAQYAGFVLAAHRAIRLAKRDKKSLGSIFLSPYRGGTEGGWSSFHHFFAVNRDIFLRTLCLVSVMMFFTSAGSWQGETILAVNTLLMQLFILFSYIMDGFAFAGEALGGKYYGAGDNRRLALTIRSLFKWGLAATVLFTATYAVGGSALLSLLTDDTTVVSASQEYIFWALLMPVAGVAAFVWDGIYIGCTATRGMLVAVFAAAVVFFTAYYTLRPMYANHALWLSFIAYLLTRGIVQTFLRPKA